MADDPRAQYGRFSVAQEQSFHGTQYFFGDQVNYEKASGLAIFDNSILLDFGHFRLPSINLGDFAKAGAVSAMAKADKPDKFFYG
jgi:hypothetical protein